MGFREALRVREGESGRQQLAPDSAAAHAVIDNEPSQMGDLCAHVLAVDGDGADNLVSLHRGPYRVPRVLQTVAEGGQPSCHNRLETLPEGGRSRIYSACIWVIRAMMALPISADYLGLGKRSAVRI